MARKRVAAKGSASGLQRKKARTESLSSPNPLPADPTDTPYNISLNRAPHTTALKLSIHRSSPTSAYYYDSIAHPEDGHTWRRGDIGDIEYGEGDVGRIMVLDIVQEDSPQELTEADTFLAIAWLYTVGDAQAAGVNTPIDLGPSKTYVISTHVQMIRYGGFSGGPLSALQRAREIVDDRILDFGTRPYKVRSLARKGCHVVEAIQFARNHVHQETKVTPKQQAREPRASHYEGPFNRVEEKTDPARKGPRDIDASIEPYTPPPDYTTDDPSEHATPLDPRLSSPEIVAADGTFDEPDTTTTNSAGESRLEAAPPPPAMFNRLRQSFAILSPFKK